MTVSHEPAGGSPLRSVPPHAFDVLVALPNEMVRCGLETMLEGLPPVSSVRSSGDSRETNRLLLSRQIDVMVTAMDPDPESVVPLVSLAAANGTQTLLLLGTGDQAQLSRAATLPVAGFLLGSGLTRESLAAALRTLAAGDMPMPDALTRRLLSQLRRAEHLSSSRSFLLTPREHQALTLLSKGLSNKQIARRLSISEHGAKRHVANVLAKLNCPNRTLAVAVALRHGLLPELGPTPAEPKPASWR